MKNVGLKILVLGGSGLIGSEVAKKLSSFHAVVSPAHEKVDVTDKQRVKDCIETIGPEYVIYAAGLARVDEAEENPERSSLLDFEAPRFIADQLAGTRIPFCYLSTNAVFDGTQSERPCRENDETNPVSRYGKNKRRGEEAVLSASARNLVVRLTLAYSASHTQRKDPARIILESLRQGKPTLGIIDQYLTPLYAPTIAQAIDKIIGKGSSGIYHLGSTDSCTNYEFAKKIAEVFAYDENLVFPTTLKEFSKHRPARREQYSWLSTDKFQNEFGRHTLRTIDEDLADFKDAMDSLP